MGVEMEKICILMAFYVDKSNEYIINESNSDYLIFKDNSYSTQNEFRIIIATDNKEFIDKLQNNNNNIIIGDISDIILIDDNIYDDIYLHIH